MSRAVRRIGLNGLFLDYPHSGTWTYTRNLTRSLAAIDPSTEYRLAVRRADVAEQLPANVIVNRPAWPLARGQSRFSLVERADKAAWEQLGWPLNARRCSLMHSLYFAGPALHFTPLVVTVHDCLSLDPQYQHSRAAAVYALAMRQTVRRANALITVSQHARTEISRRLDYPADKIFVTLEAPDPAMHRVTGDDQFDRFRAKHSLPARYVLYLGGTERRKNLETLIRAWARVPEGELKLVVIGQFPLNDPLFPDVRILAGELGIEERVIFVPFIDQVALPGLYSHADLFCYPSNNEGFGLPPIEAMACGAPVLASNAASLPEVLGMGANLISPADVDGWAMAMTRAISDAEYRSELAERGSKWVKRYSWESTARATVDVYDHVLRSSS